MLFSLRLCCSFFSVFVFFFCFSSALWLSSVVESIQVHWDLNLSSEGEKKNWDVVLVFTLFLYFFVFLFYLILFFMCFVCLWFILSFFLTRFYGWMEYFVQNFPLAFNPSEDSNTKTKIQEKQEPAYLALILMSENKKSPVHHKNERTNVLQHQHQLKQNKKHKKATCLQNIHTRTNKDDVFHISPLAENFFIWHFSLRFVLIFFSQFFIFLFCLQWLTQTQTKTKYETLLFAHLRLFCH